MIPDFTLHSPTRIHFGVGVVDKLGEQVAGLGLNQVLVVCDKGVVDAGLLSGVLVALEGIGTRFEVFDQVVPNPRIETVQAGVKVYQDCQARGLVAVGGGSCLDAAKGIGIVAKNGGTVDQYEYGRNKIVNGIPPLVAIPTTAGTGSEVTPWAVISNTKRCDKMDIGDGTSAAAPTLALVDPRLTLTLPASVTAATGMDALTHAIEGYTSWQASPVTDLLNLEAIGIIASSLRPAVARGDLLSWRSPMLYASLLAGMGFANSSCGLVHAIAQKLGGLSDVPHGVANAIFLPYVMQFNLIAAPQKFAKIAQAMGEPVDHLAPMEAARKAVQAVQELITDVRIPSLRELGVRESQFETLAEGALHYLDAKGNARPATLEDNLRILRDAYSMSYSPYAES